MPTSEEEKKALYADTDADAAKYHDAVSGLTYDNVNYFGFCLDDTDAWGNRGAMDRVEPGLPRAKADALS